MPFIIGNLSVSFFRRNRRNGRTKNTMKTIELNTSAHNLILNWFRGRSTISHKVAARDRISLPPNVEKSNICRRIFTSFSKEIGFNSLVFVFALKVVRFDHGIKHARARVT